MCLDVCCGIPVGNEIAANMMIGPPTAEALMYGMFQLQKKMRHTRITRIWYRK
jgi:NADH:ubiquinone oxidoreductase subunit B-like Fe-S oxidoreductase